MQQLGRQPLQKHPDLLREQGAIAQTAMSGSRWRRTGSGQPQGVAYCWHGEPLFRGRLLDSACISGITEPCGERRCSLTKA